MGQPCKRNIKQNKIADNDAMLKEMLHSANIANQNYSNDYIVKKLADSIGNYKSRYKPYKSLEVEDTSDWMGGWFM